MWRKRGEPEVAVKVAVCYSPCMRIRNFGVILAALAGSFVVSTHTAAETKPNVVFILTDDLGVERTGVLRAD